MQAAKRAQIQNKMGGTSSQLIKNTRGDSRNIDPVIDIDHKWNTKVRSKGNLKFNKSSI